MKDSADTHHHHDSGAGLWLAVLIGLVLVASSGAIAAALTELVRLLLIVLAVTAGFSITTCLILAVRYRQPRPRIRAVSRPAVIVQPADQSRREIAALRSELVTLRQHVASVTAPDDLRDLDNWQPRSLGSSRPRREG